MNVGAIIQARTSSKRYPKKVLRTIAGKPLLLYILERLKHCDFLSSVIIATSTDESDDPIEQFALNHNVECFRGDLDNVVSRFIGVLVQYDLDVFVRVNADSPLIDPALINGALAKYQDGDYDIVTNTLERSYPKGQSVEIINAKTFKREYKKITCKSDLEHVTSFFYKHHNNYRIYNFKYERNCSHIQLSIDTEQDAKILNTIINKMNKPHWEYGVAEIIDMYQKVSH